MADTTPKLTPELQAEFVRILRAGNFLDTASSLVGVHRRTVQDWIRRGRRARDAAKPLKADLRYVDFAVAVEKAQAEAEAGLKQLITNAAKDVEVEKRFRCVKCKAPNTVSFRVPGTWSAAAWHLSHLLPGKYGQKVSLAVRDELERAVSALEHEFADEPETMSRIAHVLTGLDS